MRQRSQISFEPGFGAYQGLKQKMNVPFPRFSAYFCSSEGSRAISKTRAKPRYAPNSGETLSGGAATASCGETVVQKGVFGESVSSLPPEGLLLKHLKGPESLKGAEKKRTLQ